jgi:hypothetical protein
MGLVRPAFHEIGANRIGTGNAGEAPALAMILRFLAD